MSWKSLLFVFLGGGIGSIVRYGISYYTSGISHKFPYATLISNIAACLILGYLMGMTSKNLLSSELKMLLMVGFCGGFSTFSTFSAESYQLFQSGSVATGFLYMIASFTICLVCIYFGLQIGSRS